MSLASHLLTVSRDAYQRATQHPFLEAAGNNSISKQRLERWLTQDRIYAFVGYPKFISLLTSRVPLHISPTTTPGTLPERTLTLLSSSLSNIVRELEFFNQTAHEHGLDITTPPATPRPGVENDLTAPVTKAYTDFMIATAATGSLVDGLVLLWATEQCYLDAWTYARSHHTPPRPLSAGTSQALDKFIQNWTSDAFRAFVQEIGVLLDEHAASASPREYEELKARAEEVWRWTLWYEERFWDGE